MPVLVKHARVSPEVQPAYRQFNQETPYPFQLNGELLENFQMQKVYGAIAEDFQRNEMIISDIRHSIDNGFSPMVLTERTSHLKYLAGRLRICVPHVIVLKGGMGKLQYKKEMDYLKSIPIYEERGIVATGRYSGDGFDDARLDVRDPRKNVEACTYPIEYILMTVLMMHCGQCGSRRQLGRELTGKRLGGNIWRMIGKVYSNVPVMRIR